MSLGKWLSLAVGIAVALLVTMFQTAPAYPPVSGGLGRAWHLAVTNVFMSAAGLGLAMGLLHWLIVSRFDTELLKVVGYIESLGRRVQGASARSQDLSLPALEPRTHPGLSQIAQAAERTISALRQRNEQLVAQRRELEVQLRIADAERRHVEAILNTISDGVIVTDAFNEVALMNEAAARALGFDLGEAMSSHKPVEQAVPDPTLVKLIKDTREGGDASLRRHVEHTITRNGRTVVYDVTLAILTNRDSSGSDSGDAARPHALGAATCAGVVTILRDITYEKEVAEMKTEFVSNVSHELRTPLSSIKAYVEMLVDGEAEDEQTRGEFYNIIQGETNRLQRLIDNILNISRIESGVVKVQREYISLPQVVSEVIDVMRPQARAKQIELVYSSVNGSSRGSSGGFFPVFADRDMIYQAVLNLVSNAIKYTPADGNGRVDVAINVDDASRSVTVSVTDNGVGIAPSDLAYLFQKFYRVQDHKKIAKGTGLGLNLVKQIIETVHGGKVWVQSRVGSASGSTFSFSLPLADNAS